MAAPGGFIHNLWGLLAGAGSKIVETIAPNLGRGAVRGAGALTAAGAAGAAALQVEEAIRGPDSCGGRAKQRERDSNAAAGTSGMWTGIKGGIAGFLRFIQSLFPGGMSGLDGLITRLETTTRRASDRDLGQDIRAAVNDPGTLPFLAAAPVAGAATWWAMRRGARGAAGITGTGGLDLGDDGFAAMQRAQTGGTAARAADAAADVAGAAPARGLSGRARDALLGTTRLGRWGRAAALVGGTAFVATAAFAEEAPEGGQPAPSEGAPAAPAEDRGIVGQATDFARGLARDASSENWTAGNAANLAHAAGHGIVRGVGGFASFAFANTVGWFTGHTTDDIDRNYVGAAIDAGFQHTIGLPNMSGHWAQAVNTAASFAAPAGAIGGLAMRTSQAFRWATAGTNLVRHTNTVRRGTQFALETQMPG